MHKNLPSEQGVKMIGKHKHNLLLGPITARRRKSPGFEVAICFLPSHFTNTERKAHGVSLVWLSESTNVVHGKLKCQITRAILLPQSHACWLLTKCVPESRKALAPLEDTRRRVQMNGLDLLASARLFAFWILQYVVWLYIIVIKPRRPRCLSRILMKTCLVVRLKMYQMCNYGCNLQFIKGNGLLYL